MKIIQIIIILIALAIAGVALLIFGGILPGFGTQNAGQTEGSISFWGTLSEDSLKPAINDFNLRFKNIKAEYRQIDQRNYVETLVSALAAGSGPDVFLLPQDKIVELKELVFALDAKTYPLRAFRDNFADISELYARPDGIIGLPLYTDPLILYWNRDLFRNAGLSQPPKYWDEFLEASKALTIRDGSRLTQSGAALGEFSNIKNAKDILAMLMLQTGNNITNPITLLPVFDQKDSGSALSPAEEALLFFVSFSNPTKSNYSWSRAQPQAIEAFGAGRLAMYIGYASESEQILALNPHLSFDVREVPQIRGGRIQATFGKSEAMSLSKQSANKSTALTFMYEMTGAVAQEIIGRNSFLAPSIRSGLAESQENPILDVIYKSAIRSIGWIDPDPENTALIWKEMAESVSSNSKSINQAVTDAKRKFDALIR